MAETIVALDRLQTEKEEEEQEEGEEEDGEEEEDQTPSFGSKRNLLLEERRRSLMVCPNLYSDIRHESRSHEATAATRAIGSLASFDSP